MSRQIYVGRLGSKAKREDLQQEFDKFGKIRDIDLRSTHAFIEFEAPEEARDAIDKMDGKRLNTGGDRITVKPRDDRPSGARGPTPRDVCFNCGRKGHWANECKEGDLRDTCYRCYQKGHIRKDCPKSRTPSSKRRYSRRDKDKKRRRSSSSSSSSESSRSRSKRRHRQSQKNTKKPRRRTPSSRSSERSNSSSSSRYAQSRYRNQQEPMNHERVYIFITNINIIIIIIIIIMDIRVNRKQQPTAAEQRIKNMLNIDVIERIQALKAEYLKSHPDPQIDIQQGYVMHPIPLRACDLLKIHHYKKGLFDKTPKQQQQQQTRYKIAKPLYSIANKIIIDSRNNEFLIEQDTNVSLIACLPAFYTRQQSCSKMKSNKSSIVPPPSVRIRSISNVYDFLTRPSTQNRPTTSNIKQRH